MKCKTLNSVSEFCYIAHSSVNQKYGEHLYSYHLDMVASFGEKYKHYIDPKDHDLVLKGCYAHDLLEDTNYTYNDLVKFLGEDVAELSYALQNEKGRNRKERANSKYYQAIRETPYAVFIKLCDRLANMTFSKDQSTGSSMISKYRDELEHFLSELGVSEGQDYEMMVEELRGL